jgi:S-DNA-T family DNA segregation ATPase FtsK/SpoIIIE
VAKLIVESGQASTSYVQRKFRIGYNRAARLMDEMEAAGIVSAPEGENKPRKILATLESIEKMGS